MIFPGNSIVLFGLDQPLKQVLSCLYQLTFPQPPLIVYFIGKVPVVDVITYKFAKPVLLIFVILLLVVEVGVVDIIVLLPAFTTVM